MSKVAVRSRLAGIALLALASAALAGCDMIAGLTGTTYRYVIQADLEAIPPQSDTDAQMARSMEVIERRLSGMEVDVQSISFDGEGRIAIEATGRDLTGTLAAMLGRTGKLEFRLVEPDVSLVDIRDGLAPPGTEILPSADTNYPSMAVRRLGGIDGVSVRSARLETDERTGQPIVIIEFDERGATQLARITSDNTGSSMAIVLDDVILSAPIISEPVLGGTLQMGGSIVVMEGEQLVSVLNSGPLPVPFTLVEAREVD